jgi:hypothetical protein
MTKEKTDPQGLTVSPASNFAAFGEGGNALATVASEYGLDASLLTKLKVPAGGGQFWEVETTSGVDSFKALEFIVITANLKLRSWYRLSPEEAGDGDSAPDCTSQDSVNGSCQFAQWESDRNGGKGQDCAKRGRIVGFIPGTALPVILSVPRTSLKAFQKYALGLIGEGGHPSGVVTELVLTKKQSGNNNYSVIEYRKLRTLTKDELHQMVGYRKAMASAFAD